MTRPPVHNVQTNDGRVIGFAAERLTTRPLEQSDAGWLAELHRDPDVMATIGGIRTDTESAEWLAANLEHWDTHGYGQWVLTKVGFSYERGIDHPVGPHRFYRLTRTP